MEKIRLVAGWEEALRVLRVCLYHEIPQLSRPAQHYCNFRGRATRNLGFFRPIAIASAGGVEAGRARKAMADCGEPRNFFPARTLFGLAGARS
jgi:hypothetical protein